MAAQAWTKRSRRKRKRQEDIRRYIKIASKEKIEEKSRHAEGGSEYVSVFLFSNGVRNKTLNKENENVSPDDHTYETQKKSNRNQINEKVLEECHSKSEKTIPCSLESHDDVNSNEHLVMDEDLSEGTLLSILNCNTQDFLDQLL